MHSNEKRVQDCLDEGKSLIDHNHDSKFDVQTEMNEILNLWSQLKLECEIKGMGLIIIFNV